MEQDDQILLNELKSGNPSAYERVFKKYYKMLVAKAYFVLEDEMEAEDLVQNLFVTMWQKSHFISIKTSLKSYLYGAIHNQCMMVIRDRKVADKRMNSYKDVLAGDEYDEEGEIEDETYQGRLDLAFQELPLQRQRAFKLVYVEDKKYKEAAEEMGLSVNSIKTHLKLAVKALKDKLIKFK